MKDKEKIKNLEKRIRNRNTFLLILLGVTIFAIIVAILSTNMEYKRDLNEKVLYCEIANLNGQMIDELYPYLLRFLDESIETVSEINSTLGNLLDMRTVGTRDFDYPELDCPIEKCNYPIIRDGTVEEEICNMIREIKYEVKD